MKTGKPLYITTTLPYVNADPHIGFALELVHADIYTRYKVLEGNEVFFNTGTDEHGLKIYRKALEEGKDTQAYTDEYAEKFRALKEKLALSVDIHFVRTTDPHHKKAAQELWRRCVKAGDIYKKKYKGLYCVGDEMFLRESDLVNGRCPNHSTMVPEEIEEENYFFKLSKYQERLKTYLSQPNVIVPEWRRQEALNFIEQGLEDFSVSRDKTRLPWGVSVPEDESQTMYVWFDALTNYISTLGWPDDVEGNFAKFWTGGETLQLAGKDQVRFQSIMWQAMLMSAGLKPTDRVVYHGFITSGGQKMSKSLGTGIDPMPLVDEYGTDALRHFLSKHIHPFDDSDFTTERFKDAYNADLANGLGNFVSRVTTMAQQHGVEYDVPASEKALQRLELSVNSSTPTMEAYRDDIDRYEFHNAVTLVWEEIAIGDSIIQKEKPFELIKTDERKAKETIADLMQRVFRIAIMLEPFMPRTSLIMKEAIITNKKPENLFPRKDEIKVPSGKMPQFAIVKKKKKKLGWFE